MRFVSSSTRYRWWKGYLNTHRLLAKKIDSNRYRFRLCMNLQGTVERQWVTHLPFCIVNYLRQKNQITGGRITLAVPEIFFYQSAVRSTNNPGWSLSSRSLSQYCLTPQEWIWTNECLHCRETPLGEDRWVYIWVECIYSGLRSGRKITLCIGYHWSQWAM